MSPEKSGTELNAHIRETEALREAIHKFIEGEEDVDDRCVLLRAAERDLLRHEQRLDHVQERRESSNAARATIKATPEQIDRWAKIAEEDLQEYHAQLSGNMHQRHDLERLKSQGKILEMRHKADELLLTQRRDNDLKRLRASIDKAHQTGIIPDPHHTPLHTKEQIDAWAKEQRKTFDISAELSPKKIVQWEQWARGKLRDRHRAQEAPSEPQRNPENERHSAEQADLQKQIEAAWATGHLADPEDYLEMIIQNVYEAGRIPEQDQAKERDRGDDGRNL